MLKVLDLAGAKVIFPIVVSFGTSFAIGEICASFPTKTREPKLRVALV